MIINRASIKKYHRSLGKEELSFLILLNKMIDQFNQIDYKVKDKKEFEELKDKVSKLLETIGRMKGKANTIQSLTEKLKEDLKGMGIKVSAEEKELLEYTQELEKKLYQFWRVANKVFVGLDNTTIKVYPPGFSHLKESILDFHIDIIYIKDRLVRLFELNKRVYSELERATRL